MSTVTSLPTVDQLNEKLENFKDWRFAAAQAANAEKELTRFDGRNIESFRRGDYHGCDFSPDMVHIALTLNPGCEIVQADARKLDFPDKRFDVIWVSALLEHVPEIERVLAEAARVGRRYLLLHRLFLHRHATERRILTTGPDEYPFEGFSYPRTIRNVSEFETTIMQFGRITRRQPWAFDPTSGKNLCLYSYALELG
jgi:SAM-dependent methyltransferase